MPQERSAGYKVSLQTQSWEENKTFLINADNTIKKNHKYYSQIQGQRCVLD